MTLSEYFLGILLFKLDVVWITQVVIGDLPSLYLYERLGYDSVGEDSIYAFSELGNVADLSFVCVKNV
jgi:hypothetical protein